MFTEAFWDLGATGVTSNWINFGCLGCYDYEFCCSQQKASSKKIGQLKEMALRKLREVIRDGQRPVSRRLELNVLKEETDDSEITDAATVIIGSELSASERQSLRGGFVNDMTEMSESGRTIVATVVALE